MNFDDKMSFFTRFEVWSLLELKEIILSNLSVAIDQMAQASIASKVPARGSDAASLSKANRDTLNQNIQVIGELAIYSEMVVLRAAVSKATSVLENKESTVSDFYAANEYLRNVFYDTINSYNFLVIDNSDLLYWKQYDPMFGDEVESKFPEIRGEIREAGKCISVDRHTAAVFHLMRIIEFGLKKMSSELGIPYAPSWEAYINQLSKILDSKNYKNLTDDQKNKREFYRNILTDITSIKQSCRNPTMHFNDVYDEEQAKNIFTGVKAFIKHLASNLS